MGKVKKEFAAGAVIFRRENRQVRFLLIYSRRNKIWGFPKGHLDSGESEKQAGLREIEEETGIAKVRFVSGFREEDVYEAVSNRGASKGDIIEKHSVYFLAETKTKEVCVDKEEIGDYKWVSAAQAMKLIVFPGLKQILRKAQKSIKRENA